MAVINCPLICWILYCFVLCSSCCHWWLKLHLLRKLAGVGISSYQDPVAIVSIAHLPGAQVPQQLACPAARTLVKAGIQVLPSWQYYLPKQEGVRSSDIIGDTCFYNELQLWAYYFQQNITPWQTEKCKVEFMLLVFH